MRAQLKWPLLAAASISTVIILSTTFKSQQPTKTALSDLSTPAEIVKEPLADRGIPATTPGRPIGQSVLAPPGIPREPSADEQARVRHAKIAALEQKLRSEAVNQKWASEQESVIRNALLGTPGDGFKTRDPDSMDQECRSSMCRIRMTYADEEDAIQMHGRLTLGLRGAIATAKTYFLPRPDGGVDMVIYAGANDRLR